MSAFQYMTLHSQGAFGRGQFAGLIPEPPGALTLDIEDQNLNEGADRRRTSVQIATKMTNLLLRK